MQGEAGPRERRGSETRKSRQSKKKENRENGKMEGREGRCPKRESEREKRAEGLSCIQRAV